MTLEDLLTSMHPFGRTNPDAADNRSSLTDFVPPPSEIYLPDLHGHVENVFVLQVEAMRSVTRIMVK